METLKNQLKICIGINVSPIQLLELDFIEKVTRILNKYKEILVAVVFKILYNKDKLYFKIFRNFKVKGGMLNYEL